MRKCVMALLVTAAAALPALAGAGLLEYPDPFNKPAQSVADGSGTDEYPDPFKK